jgi:DNA-binding NarL/FixJ family response regulator
MKPAPSMNSHPNPQESVIRIALVDDHVVVREGYKRYIELETDMRVCMEAATAESAYAMLGQHTVDVLVMDLSMPGSGGLEGIRHILSRYHTQKILVFSMHQNAGVAMQALRAGAMGYLTKNMPPELIVQAIRDVHAGCEVISPDLQADIARLQTDSTILPHLSLTPREFDIFLMLADGKTVEEISTRLKLGSKTVANYQTLIRQKMTIHNAVDLYRYATEHGLL